MQIHVALSEPLSWRDTRLAKIRLIHLSDGSASTGIACAEAEAGLLPRQPTVVVGQQYLLDPCRVPAGASAWWLQLQEVPCTAANPAATCATTSSANFTSTRPERLMKCSRVSPSTNSIA